MALTSTYNPEQLAQVDDMRAYFDEYFRSIGKDPAACFAPDGTLIDTDLKNDPAFLVYWQTAYMQMLEVVEPSLINSLEASVGEIDFDALYDNMSPAMASFIDQLDPEIRGCLALADGDSEDGNSLVATLSVNNNNNSDSSGSNNKESVAFLHSNMYLEADDESTLSYDADAHALMDAHDMGEGYTWLTSFTEGQGALTESFLDMLNQCSQARAQANIDLANGEDVSSVLDEISINEQILFAGLQDVIGTTQTITEMYSKMVEKETDIKMAIINNYRAYS